MVYPSLRAIRLRYGHSHRAIFSCSFRSIQRPRCPPHHLLPLPQLFIDLQLASKHVITRLLVRGCLRPPASADCHEAWLCVCEYVYTRKYTLAGLSGVGSRNTSVVFDGTECCRVTWNIGFREKGFVDCSYTSE